MPPCTAAVRHIPVWRNWATEGGYGRLESPAQKFWESPAPQPSAGSVARQTGCSPPLPHRTVRGQQSCFFQLIPTKGFDPVVAAGFCRSDQENTDNGAGRSSCRDLKASFTRFSGQTWHSWGDCSRSRITTPRQPKRILFDSDADSLTIMVTSTTTRGPEARFLPW